MLRRTLAPALALGVVALLGACSAPNGQAAAIVGPATIPVSQFQRELDALKANKPLTENARIIGKDGNLSPEVVATWMQNDVQQAATDQIYAQRKLSYSPTDLAKAKAELVSQFTGQSVSGEEVVAAFPTWFSTLFAERIARGNAVINSFITTTPAQYYQTNKATFDKTCASGIVLRHILVKTQAQADAIKAKLDAGGNFEQLAAQQSIDTQSGPNGGDLGCYQSGQYIPAFDNGVKNLTPGQRVVVQSTVGYHVVEALPVNVQTLGNQIQSAQRNQAAQSFTQYLQTQLQTLQPKVNARYGVVSFGANGFSVTVAGSANGGSSGGSNVEVPRIRTKPTPTSSNPSTVRLTPAG